MICEPLELETVAAALMQAGHDVDVVDLILERKELRWFLKQQSYDFVGFTGYINHVQVIKELAREVKRVSPELRTIVGGVHAEVVPSDFADEAIDHILWANGVTTMIDVIAAPSKAQAAGLPGVWAQGKVKPPVQPLTGVFPDRSITARYRKNYNYIFHERCATLKTSFGCPFTCQFCFCTQVCPYAERDLDEVLDELTQIEEDNVFIVDDNFLYRPSRIRAFCEGLDARGIHKNFIAFGRVDFIARHPQEMAMLAEHGFEAIFIGLESFRDDELDRFGKRTSGQQNLEAVQVMEAVGIQPYSGLITGVDWTRRDFDNLIAHLNEFTHPAVNIQPITPMPGTPLFDETGSGLTLSRDRSCRWDMAHVAFKPTAMSYRAYYRNIIRAYMKTTLPKAQRRYWHQRYGDKVYRRVRRGVVGVTLQYLALVIWPY